MAPPTVAALILAAGRGRRARAPGGDGAVDIPKQYRAVGDVPVLRRSVLAFLRHPAVDHIQVVIHPDDRALYAVAAGDLPLPTPVHGSATRRDSVRAGLEALAVRVPAPTHVLIHDAARPWVSAAVIDRVVAALESHDAAVPALPVTDAVARAGPNGVAVESLDRAGLRAAQTPQGFRLSTILAAHRQAADSDRDMPDDMAVAAAAGTQALLVDGDPANIKITAPEDFGHRPPGLLPPAAPGGMRVSQGFDAHRFGPGDTVILCGVPVPHTHGLAGHSDADVALHALADALLGAAGGGDIGQHFPPGDPQWRNAPSRLFVEEAARMLRARGGEVANADITIICEAPRIGPRRAAMEEAAAAAMGVSAGQVSVKATTTEGMGFTGRSEGIAAQAIVLANGVSPHAAPRAP